MAVLITEIFYPQIRNQWRHWLSQHHATKKEIWLVFYKKRAHKPTIGYQDALDEALCFGWIDGIEKSIDGERYVLRFTPRKTKSHWSQANISRFQVFNSQGLVLEAGKRVFKTQ